MGGYGSGRRYRRDTKTTTDAVRLKLDIRVLCQRGLALGQGSCVLSWTQSDREVGSIQCDIGESQLLFSYNQQVGNNPSRDVTEVVLIDRTPCHYGRFRLWFLCPKCDRRVAILFFVHTRFLCRYCHRLSYSSQNEDVLARMKRRTWKIRGLLGASDNLTVAIWKKPKGMHWRTFERLRRNERLANAKVDLVWVGEARRFLGGKGKRGGLLGL
jgi:hypothetical protein